jgi:hypothetical protein
MSKLWGLAVMLVGLAFAASAHADTVYLKNGQSYWGSDIYEEGGTVVVVRPGGELKFPRGNVQRIERLRSTLPPFYAPPEPPPAPAQAGASGAAAGAPAAEGQGGGQEGPPTPGGTPPAPPAGQMPPPPPPGSGPIQLPPPPPPPAPGTQTIQ